MTRAPAQTTRRKMLHEDISAFLQEVGLHSPCCATDTTGGFTVGHERDDGTVHLQWTTADEAFTDRDYRYERVVRTMEETLRNLLHGAGWATARGPHGIGVLAARTMRHLPPPR